MTEFEYLSAMREFLLTCPYPAPVDLDYILLDQSGIEYGEITEGQGSDRFGSGTAIVLIGDQVINRRRNVWGNETHLKRVNFQVIFWRSTQENEFRRNIANFLSRFINWVNEENAKRRTPAANPMLPHFSMTDVEELTADGGIRSAVIEQGQRSEFMVQLHINYELTY